MWYLFKHHLLPVSWFMGRTLWGVKSLSLYGLEWSSLDMLLRLSLQFDVLNLHVIHCFVSPTVPFPSVGKYVLFNLVPLTVTDRMQSMIIKPIDPIDSCQTWAYCTDSVLHYQKIVISEVRLSSSEMRLQITEEDRKAGGTGVLPASRNSGHSQWWWSFDCIPSWTREPTENIWGQIPSDCMFRS